MTSVTSALLLCLKMLCITEMTVKASGWFVTLFQLDDMDSHIMSASNSVATTEETEAMFRVFLRYLDILEILGGNLKKKLRQQVAVIHSSWRQLGCFNQIAATCVKIFSSYDSNLNTQT
ncbi:uncharacterized [Lates japonicus]